DNDLAYAEMEQSYIDEYSKQARAQRPLDRALDYAYKFTTCIQELLVYVDATFPSSLNKSEKLVAVTPMNKTKNVRFEKPSKSASNIPKHADSQNPKITNKPLLTSIRVESSTSDSRSKPSGCLFNACHDMCVVDYLNNVNKHVKSRSSKRDMKQDWKPMGKVFTNVGQRWIPTGWAFIIDGTKCPLNRITSTTVVYPKTSIPASS
nr:hypothetical protein [Tanacetum cinerariifolium]